jgi:hypothetical protein
MDNQHITTTPAWYHLTQAISAIPVHDLPEQYFDVHFGRVYEALLGMDASNMQRGLRFAQEMLSPVEARALLLTWWAVNQSEPEGNDVPDVYYTNQARVLHLMERVETSREWAFVNWANDCLDTALH